MSTFIKSDQSAPNLLHASPISQSGFVHPDQRVITGLTCIKFQVPSISHSLVSQAPKKVTCRGTDGQGQINMLLNFFKVGGIITR